MSGCLKRRKGKSKKKEIKSHCHSLRISTKPFHSIDTIYYIYSLGNCGGVQEATCPISGILQADIRATEHVFIKVYCPQHFLRIKWKIGRVDQY